MKSRPILLSSMLGLVACGGPASSPITMPPIEVPAPVVPADDDAWSLLEGAMAPVTDIQWLRAELPQNQAPDAEHLDLWSQHADSLDAIESALLAPGLSIPPTPPFAEANTEDWVTPEIRLQPLARAFAIRGWQKALAGDPAGGVADILTVLRLGQRLIDASAPLIPGAIGMGISNSGFDTLGAVLRGPAATSREAHQTALDGLLEWQDHPTSAHRWTAYELHYNETELLQPLEHPSTSFFVYHVPDDFDAEFDFGASIDRFRTRAATQIEWAQQSPDARPAGSRNSRVFQDCIAAAGDNWETVRLCRPAYDYPELPTPEDAASNAYGIWFVDSTNPPFYEHSYREDWNRTLRVRTLVLVAARLYVMDNEGTVPPSVDALVPTYLPEVPTNPWDGSPVRIDDAGWVEVSWNAEHAGYPRADAAVTRVPIVTP